MSPGGCTLSNTTCCNEHGTDCWKIELRAAGKTSGDLAHLPEVTETRDGLQQTGFFAAALEDPLIPMTTDIVSKPSFHAASL